MYGYLNYFHGVYNRFKILTNVINQLMYNNVPNVFFWPRTSSGFLSVAFWKFQKEIWIIFHFEHTRFVKIINGISQLSNFDSSVIFLFSSILKISCTTFFFHSVHKHIKFDKRHIERKKKNESTRYWQTFFNSMWLNLLRSNEQSSCNEFCTAHDGQIEDHDYYHIFQSNYIIFRKLSSLKIKT